MYCENCGNEMRGMNVCSRCGHVVNMGGAVPPWRLDDTGHTPGQSGNDGTQCAPPPWEAGTSGQVEDNGVHVQKALSMKWYRFIINFQLFLAAALNVAYAGRYLGGLDHGENAELLYMLYEPLQILDWFMGAVSLGSAALCIYARGRLRRFRKNAVFVYLSISIINIVCQIIYLVSVYGILGSIDEAVIAVVCCNVGIGAVFLMYNYVYFKKRQHLFNC